MHGSEIDSKLYPPPKLDLFSPPLIRQFFSSSVLFASISVPFTFTSPFNLKWPFFFSLSSVFFHFSSLFLLSWGEEEKRDVVPVNTGSLLCLCPINVTRQCSQVRLKWLGSGTQHQEDDPHVDVDRFRHFYYYPISFICISTRLHTSVAINFRQRKCLHAQN